MFRYVVKRLLLLLLVIVGVSFMIYFIMDLAPGDPVRSILGDFATEEEYQQLKVELGYDKPMIVRYVRYMWNMLRGDMGYSFRYKMDVFDMYMQRIPATIVLALTATTVSTIISMVLGVIAALRRGSLLDNTISAVAVVGLAAPIFWVGLMLIILFALNLGWFHSGGFESLKDVVLPATCLGFNFCALMTRTTRSSMIDVLSQDYLLLARAKGVSERKVITKHALKNALIPIITVGGIKFSAALGGSVVTESVFAWPGVGRFVVDAIKKQDVEVVTGFIILTAIFSSLVLLAVDILYAFVDPRIKSQYSK